ncbi:hypothetical protein I4641_23220 [Waterburya agarophytonicola K14]|uniref:Uncharacterized protein n=1 Tax=Waterburya agarophytonicola KI4 TaxID=2874699 RepID=A0A964BUE5_9CYAN|nr:hypothetical protein [Waterburya agarophytonicola KI4]
MRPRAVCDAQGNAHQDIEILWKFIKYEWIDIEAYSSQNSLIEYLKKVLDNFGHEYVINFA